MDAITAIKSRRSIRNYTGEPISEEQLRLVLEAGFSAPSAHNFQPWEFIIIRDREKLRMVADVHPYGKMIPVAGCGILVCGNRSRQELEGFLVEDCSAAIQNMLVAANSIGLGTVWCGIHPVEQLKKSFEKTFDLPKHVMPVGIIAIGHPAEKKDAINRYDAEKVHFNTW